MISKIPYNKGVVAPEKCPNLGFQATAWTPLAAFLQPFLRAGGEWTDKWVQVCNIHTIIHIYIKYTDF